KFCHAGRKASRGGIPGQPWTRERDPHLRRTCAPIRNASCEPSPPSSPRRPCPGPYSCCALLVAGLSSKALFAPKEILIRKCWMKLQPGHVAWLVTDGKSISCRFSAGDARLNATKRMLPGILSGCSWAPNDEQ